MVTRSKEQRGPRGHRIPGWRLMLVLAALPVVAILVLAPVARGLPHESLAFNALYLLQYLTGLPFAVGVARQFDRIPDGWPRRTSGDKPGPVRDAEDDKATERMSVLGDSGTPTPSRHGDPVL
jgi:hypothetical protein